MPLRTPSAACVIAAPDAPSVPVVFDSPHSGFEFPADFTPAATRAEIQTTWDAHVDELFAGVTAAGATLIAARFPRAYIDANRAANDIDPEILDTAWPGPVELSEHSRRGMGLIRRFALPGIPMYDRRLTVAEVRARIDGHYLPYRRALEQAIDAAWQRHGAVWHFNCHSIKSRGNAMNRDQGALRPDFVIGDRNGCTAPASLTAWVAEFFMGRGYQVKINDPYRGADVVRAHGDPAHRRFSIQIEINRALYMDEATCVRSSGFAPLAADLGAFALAVRELTPQAARPVSVHT
ncbi:MAG: N-formylglutamate amidohydrolase [Opitutus sp.]|nr:N-formylglutamate amidohydrolase [Opitutus sp.]